MVFEDALAIVLAADGQTPVGAGLFLGNDLVLTCAHVANAALGRDLANSERPNRNLLIKPHSGFSQPLPASVDPNPAAWSAPRLSREPGADICLLRLDKAPEKSIQAATLWVSDNLVGQKFRAGGFPRQWNGQFDVATGEIVGKDGSGLYMLRPKSQALAVLSTSTKKGFLQDAHRPTGLIHSGFSGGPVEVKGRIIGLVVEARDQISDATAYMLPVSLLPAIIPRKWMPPEQVSETTEIEEETNWPSADPLELRRDLLTSPRTPGLLRTRSVTKPFMAPRISNFVGRETEVDDLIKELSLEDRLGDQPTIVAITGMGGWGKTTIASKIAHNLTVRSKLPDGTLWVSLGPAPSIDSALRAWAAQLGEDFSIYETRALKASALSSLLSGKRLLLVIDDVWQLESARYFIPTGCGCRVLITTRNREIARLLRGKDGVPLKTLDSDASFHLISALAPMAAANDETACRQIANSLGGHPLALTLTANLMAAEWAAHSSIEATVERIRASAEQFGEIKAALQLSYEYLPEQARKASRILSIFGSQPLTFSLAAFESVFDMEYAKSIETLSILVDRAFVEAKGGRYEVHPLVGTFLQELGVNRPEERKLAVEACANFYIGLAKSTSVEQWLRLEAELDQIQRAFAAVQESKDNAKILAFWDAVDDFFKRRGLWVERRQWTEVALRAALLIDDKRSEARARLILSTIDVYQARWQDANNNARLSQDLFVAIGDQVGASRALVRMGFIFERQGMWNEALRYYEQGRDVLETLGSSENKQSLAEVLLRIGDIHSYKNSQQQAIEFYERGLGIYDEVHDRVGYAQALFGLGRIYRARRQWKEASEKFQECREIWAEVGDLGGKASALNNLGLVNIDQRAFEEALEFLEESKNIRGRVGDRRGIAQTLAAMGTVYLRKGELPTSLQLFMEAKEIQENINDRAGLAQIFINIGLVWERREDWKQALDYYELCREIRDEIGDQQGLAWALNNLGVIERRLGNLEQAVSLQQRSLDKFSKIEDLFGVSKVLNNLGDTLRRLGRYEKSEEHLSKSLAMREELGDKGDIAQTLANLGMLWEARKDWDKALAYYERCSVLREEKQDRPGLGWALNAIGSVLRRKDELGKAEKALTESLAIREELGDKGDIAQTLANLGMLWEARKDWDKALAYYERCSALREEKQDRPGLGWALNAIGSVLRRKGELGRAEKALTESLAMREELGDKGDIAQTLANLGMLWEVRKDWDKALAYYERCSALREEKQDRPGLGWALNAIGSVLRRKGELGRAEKALTESLAIREELGDKGDIAQTLTNLGLVCEARADWDKAIEHFSRCRTMYFESGDCVGQARTSNQIAIIWKTRGKPALAIENFRESLGIYQELGDKVEIARSLTNLGVLAENDKNWAAAIEHYERSLGIRRDLDDQVGTIWALTRLAFVHQKAKQLEDAQRYFKESLTLAEIIGDFKAVLTSLEGLGGVFELKGDHDAAISEFLRAKKFAEQSNDNHSSARLLSLLGRASTLAGREEIAIEYLNESADIYRRLGNHAETGRITAEIGRLLEKVSSNLLRIDLAEIPELEPIEFEEEGFWDRVRRTLGFSAGRGNQNTNRDEK
jgi:tetratricopeptide (TPR) repeat protein